MKFHYCPQCGKKGTIQQESISKYVCKSCGWEFWNNPKAAAAVLFINDKNEILFAKRGRYPDKGKYDLPGGFLDYDEDPFAAAVREIREETGAAIIVEDLTLLAAYTMEYIPGVSVLDLVMTVKKWKGGLRAADDVAELEWKPRTFIHDPLFRLDYPGLDQKIDAYLSA